MSAKIGVQGVQRKVIAIEKKELVKVSTRCNIKMENLIGVEIVRENKESMKDMREIHKHRHNVRTILECSNATPLSYSGIGFTCCFCKQQFQLAPDLKKHTIEVHDHKIRLGYMQDKLMHAYVAKLDITSLHCTICRTGVDTLEQLVRHLEDVHHKILFTDIKNHIISFKIDDDVLRCAICAKVFHSYKMLREHMNNHYRNFICTVCDSGFVNRNELTVHSESHKTGTFKCDVCPKVFNTLAKKRSHNRSVHVFAHKLLRCGYCDEKFASLESKSDHQVKLHGAIPMVLNCGACDKTFDSQRALREHTKRDHLVQRQHKCSECDMAFYKKHELKDHMVKHTGLREFKCELCGKEYGRKKTLREHMRSHNNDRRFKCQRCGQAFVQKCSWRAHMRNRHSEVV